MPWIVTVGGVMSAAATGWWGDTGAAIAIPFGNLCGAALGLVNGVGVAYLRVPSTIFTLGINAVAQGLMVVQTGGFAPQDKSAPAMHLIATGRSLLGIPNALLVWHAVGAATMFLLHRTTLGRATFAVGNREREAKSAVRLRYHLALRDVPECAGCRAPHNAPMRTDGAPALTPEPVRALLVERLSDQLALILAEQIDRGALQPGDRLPTEAALAAMHGVSRTVVREALHQLKSRGPLRSRQGSGAFVEPAAMNQPLAFDSRVLASMTSVVQVVEVPHAFEGEIATLAAERATRTQVKALPGALLGIDESVAAGGDGVAEDLAFHRMVADATGNPRFALLLGFLEQYFRDVMRVMRVMRVTRGNEARRADFAAAVRVEHAAIVTAIAAHDADAARRMAGCHMLRAAQRLAEGGVIAAGPARRRVPGTGKPGPLR